MSKNEFNLDLIGCLQQAQSKKQINADIRQIEKSINMLRITGTLAKGDTKKEINAYIKEMSDKLSYVKLKGKIDEKNLKQEINKSLHNMSFEDIDALKVDENKTKLKLKKVIADIRAFAEKNTISVNVGMKKEKLNNDLTTFLNKNSKIRESSFLLEESERIRELINSVDDKGTLKNATEAFQLYKSEVSATGYKTKSTTDKIKDMLSHVTKIGSLFGLASLAVNNFKKSLSTLKGNDTILTEISKTSEMTKKQLEELGNEAFKVASKYGQLSSGYLLGVQEMARSGYEELSKALGELSLLTQAAGDMTAENANNYLLATDAAYKYGGSVEKLNAALDGANYISNRNSASLTDIADATRVSASFAANASVAIDELTAAEATMIAVTKRSGSEIGRAFRSIVLNLQQVSGEFDGEVIDEEQLKKVEARCHSLGVELEYMKDGVATLRNPMEVLKDLARVYNSLPDNSADKQGLISDLGGKYHANALSSLLSRWDLYEKMLSEFSQGTGSALEEAEKTANSWEGRLNSLSNSFTSFVNVLTNKDTIMGGISFFDRLIQGAETLTNTVGEIPVVLTALNSALVATNKDYGITQIWNKDKGKIDLQGNLFGIDITNIKNMKKHFAEAEEAIAGWNRKLMQGQTDINKFGEAIVQNNAQFKEYLSTCTKDAPASLEGYKAHLKAAGVSTDALRLKTVLLNAAISMGTGIALQFVMKGVVLLVQKISDLVHASEQCKERVDELMSSYQSTLDKANSNAKTVEDLVERYETLSKGVNNLGETYGLTAEETKEYHDICNQIADMFPTLVQGYTNEGNAILSLKGNIEQLRDAYKEAQQEAYNLLIVDGKDSDGNDIIKNWENLHSTNFFSRLFDFGAADVGGDISTQNAIEQLKALSEMSAETYRNLEKITSSGSRKDIATLSDIEKEIGYGSYIYKALGIDGTVTDKDFEAVKKEAKALIQTYQAEINSALKNVQTLANAYLMTNEDYAKLDDQSKNAASIIVNSINEGIVSGFENKEDVGEYVIGIVDTLKDNPEIQDALVGLFTLDASDMQPDKAKALIDQYINFIASVLEENPVELKVRLGFEDTDTIASNYKFVMQEAAEKFAEKTPSAKESRSLYNTELNELSKFAEENSINTQDEIAFWKKCIDESETRKEAMEKYLGSSAVDESSASLSTALTSSADSLDKFQSSVKSAADAYTTLLTGNFSSSELLDSIQTINKAASDMGESIDWETISTSGNPLQAIQDAIESVSKTYADSVLSGAGIDADSKFGQMLANIVQESYKSESALSSLNTQVDSLQSAYNNLTDIVTAYNETGYITFDQLQTLLAMEPQYLSCLVDENGQLQLNQESMLALANQRLNDAEAQAVQQAITELNELELQNEKTAVEENAQAFSNAVNDLAAYNEELAGTIGEASIASSVIHDLNTAINGAEAQGASDVQIGTVLDNLNTKLQLIRNTRLNLGKSMGNIVGGKTSPSASSSAKSEFEETVDFFKQRVEVLDDALSHLDTTLDNVAGSFGKNSLIDAELGINEEKFNNYTDALSMYTQKANEAFSKIPADIASRVKDGAVALTDFIGDGNKDVAEAIKEYESWADKVADCKQELAELQKEIRKLELEKFNNIMDDFENQFNLRGDSKDLISKQIDLLKETGELIGESFYTAQIDQSQKQLALLENEKAQLVNQMSSAISSGKIQSGTEEWLSMVNALNSVDGSILDCKKSIEEFDNELLNLHTEVFNRIQEQFSNFDSEISNIVDLFDDFEVSDDKGIWSKEAIAQLGLLSQQYELAQYRVQQYNDEIDKLNAQYLSGKYSATEYADNLAGLNSSMWDSVKASESALSSIMNLNEARVENAVKGIEKEIDAYKELIDAQLDSLDQEKALHDYKSSIADKTQDLTNIDRQIAAVKNDTSASGIARLKKLQSERTEAKKALEEAEYEHSIESQQTALNHQLKDYEESRNEEIDKLRESLNDKEAILAESFDTVKNNAALVGQEIATIATRHGVTVSNALISSWQSGENAIASYGEVLSQNTSVFIGNIMGVENEVWNLQAQADVTADSLANMFGTSADNLVNELNASYFAEANLANMTNALQQSLVNTLERGYDVSSIVNSLNAVTDAANRAKAATSSIGNSNAGLTYTGFNNSDADRKYSVKDEHNKSLFTGNLSQCQAWVSAHNYGFGSIVGDDINVIDNNKKNAYTSVSAKHLKKYASGAKNIEEDQLAITNEAGQELVYHTADGSILTPLRPGDKVFENEAVNRLWQLGHGIVPPDMTKNLAIPTVLPNVSNSTNVHFDSMFRIEGDVIDADRITRRMEETACKIADRQIDKNWREFSKELRYGGSASSMYARK